MVGNRRCLGGLRQTCHENKTSVRTRSSGCNNWIGQLRPSRSFHQLQSWVARASLSHLARRGRRHAAVPAAGAGGRLQTGAALRTGGRVSPRRAVSPGGGPATV